MGIPTEQRIVNRVSYTETDFMEGGNERGRLFANMHDEEVIPPADKNIFDQSPDDVREYEFDSLQLESQEWEDEPLHPEMWFGPNIFDEEDSIRVPALDSNMKWSPRNPVVTLHNMSRETLARAVSGGEASIHGAQLSILEELKRMTHAQSTKQSEPNYWISESEITDKDVICERGGKSNRHDGTKRYRGIIEKFKPEYQAFTAKTDKTNLSRKIISQIQGSGGRFLKKDDHSGHYFVLNAIETVKKVSQALREKKVLKWTDDL